MDEQLYRILTLRRADGGQDMRALTDAIQGYIAEQSAMQQASEQRKLQQADAIMGQIEQQRMFDQLMRPPSSYGAPKDLGPGAVSDYGQLMSAVKGGGAPAAGGVADPDFDRTSSRADLLNVFARLKSEGSGSAFNPNEMGHSPDAGGIGPDLYLNEATGKISHRPPLAERLEAGPERLQLERRGMRGMPDARVGVKYAESYSGPRSQSGMAEATKMRGELTKQYSNFERERMKQEYGAKNKELSAATALAVQSMRDTRELEKRRLAGPRGADPFKWAKEGLDNAQQNLNTAISNHARLVGASAEPGQIKAAEMAIQDAQNERDAARENYDKLASGKGTGASVQPGRGKTPKPTGRTKTDKSGVTWEEMSDGSARKVGA